jgi:hypothetical protein
MANYNNINISKSFLESKRNAYDMGQDGNQAYIISTFAILNNISESKSRFILNDYVFTNFLKSNKSNFDSFVLQEMKYKKEDTMIGSDIPQSVRPERPIDDDEEDYKESLYEEDENDIDINDEYDIEEDDSEDSDTSNLPPTVIQFLKDTKLLNASDKEAKTFLLRFKDVLTETIDNESAIQLIILLLYKAKFEPETMSSGEIEELEDIVFNFTNEPDSDTSEDDSDDKEIQESYYKSLFEDEPKKKKKTDSDDKITKLDKINKVKKDVSDTVKSSVTSSVKSVYDKYPITSVLVGGAALIGIGSLALLGWYMFSKLSDIEYKKAKQKLIDEDIISDIQKGEIQNIKATIESSDVIPKDQIEPSQDDSDSDDSQDEDEPDTDDSSDDLNYPKSTINPVDGDSTTQIDSDTSNSDTSNEVSDFDSYIEEVKENESELKAELVSDTKERLQDESVRQEANKLRDKKRKYNKRNADYWDKDKVKKDKKGKGDTSKDKKKPIKKKPDVIQKGKDTKKPDTSKSKKPIDKKGDTSKKKPNVIQKGKDKKGDTSKKPVDKKSDTKPKPNENVDAYKKRTGKSKVPSGYMTDPKTKRITKKKENYEHYKILF